jgi:hypothetical protein
VIVINRRVLEQSIILIHRGMSVESILIEGCMVASEGDVRILKNLPFINKS